MLYIKLVSSKAGIRGLVFLNEDMEVLPVTYNHLVSTTANNQHTANYFTNQLFKATATTGTSPYGGPLPLTHIVNITEFEKQINYIRIIGWGTAAYWGATIDLYYSLDGINYSHVDGAAQVALKSSAFDTREFFYKTAEKKIKKLIVKKTETEKYYSLSSKKLIVLPDNSAENIIKYGLDPGVTVQLDAPFNKIDYVRNNSVKQAKGNTIQFSLLEAPNKILKIKEA